MANNKTGFDYYNVDTNRYQDIKIKRLKKDFGTSGIAVYDYILCEIYRVKGCFIVWDEITAFDVAEYFGLKETLVNEIVNYCCAVGLFNKALLKSGGIITSRSIQQRFVEMSLRAKRKIFNIPTEINILTEESAIIPEQCEIIPEVSNKVKKSKENNKIILPPIIPQGDNESNENTIAMLEEKLKEKEAKIQVMAKMLEEKKTPTKPKLVYDIDFVEDSFKDVFKSWLDYKSERKETYKSKRSLEVCYKNLYKLSNGDCETARLIVEQSMACNWAGLFELKNGYVRKETVRASTGNPRTELFGCQIETDANSKSLKPTQEDYSSRF